MIERDKIPRELNEFFMIQEENPHKIIIHGYKKALSLHDRGLTIDKLKELHQICEEGRLYLTCIGLQLAIGKLIT